tara:strand:- start:24448 stop:24858 length:411 start_codon:yes stop_codon:yes gene_type:complete
MKKVFIILFAIFASITSDAALWMYCNGNQAFVYNVDAHGNIDYSTAQSAGGCAGGRWAIPLGLASPTEPFGCGTLPCNEIISLQLRENVTLGEFVTLSEEEKLELKVQTDASTGAKLILDPMILGVQFTNYMKSLQ